MVGEWQVVSLDRKAGMVVKSLTYSAEESGPYLEGRGFSEDSCGQWQRKVLRSTVESTLPSASTSLWIAESDWDRHHQG